MGQHKERLKALSPEGQKRAQEAFDALPGEDVTLPLDYEPAKNVLWPQWVVNEMSNAIYKARWLGVEGQPIFASLKDEDRKHYTEMTYAALRWIEEQGWVKLGK